MNVDDELREAARRVRRESARVEAPPAPTRRPPGGAFAFVVAASATLVLISVAVLVGRSPEGSPPGADASTTTTAVITEETVFRGTVTIIDTGDNPMICEGGVAASFPPQCSGPVLENLDWSQVPWAESASGVTWASMTIDVHYNDGGFTLISTPAEPTAFEGEDIDFTPPCDPPPGGWVWTDDPRATPEHMDDAVGYANSQPDRSAVWVYNLSENPVEGEQRYVLVALFTGDLERHEAEIRDRWGGPLCVALGTSNAEHLLGLQTEITDLARAGTVPGLVGFGYSYVDERMGYVAIGALIASSEADDWASARYGEGVVRFEAVFTPLG